MIIPARTCSLLVLFGPAFGVFWYKCPKSAIISGLTHDVYYVFIVMLTFYNPVSTKLKRIIAKQWKLIQQNRECAELFKKTPLLAFK